MVALAGYQESVRNSESVADGRRCVLGIIVEVALRPAISSYTNADSVGEPLKFQTDPPDPEQFESGLTVIESNELS